MEKKERKERKKGERERFVTFFEEMGECYIMVVSVGRIVSGLVVRWPEYVNSNIEREMERGRRESEKCLVTFFEFSNYAGPPHGRSGRHSMVN